MTPPRPRALVRNLARVPGRLLLPPALVFALLLAAAGSSAARPAPDPEPTGGDRGTAAVLAGRVTPVSTEVARDENGDFTLTVTNTGTLPAQHVTLLLDDSKDGNGIGSSDGRCLSRTDAASPADVWCDLGDLTPQRTVAVEVHAYMNHCVWVDPDSPEPQLRAAAFHWRVGYTDGGQSRSLNGPTPRWSCVESAARTDLDTAEAGERP